MKKLTLLLITALCSFTMLAQAPKVKGVIYKDMTTAQRDALTPAAGEHWKIYNVTTGQFEYWNGTAWVALAGGGASGGTTSPLTTKGDLYTYDTDNVRLGVGTDGQVLTANSASATGLSWSTPSGIGDVTKVGTPINNQVGIWTGDGTIKGSTQLTYDTTGSVLTIAGTANAAGSVNAGVDLTAQRYVSIKGTGTGLTRLASLNSTASSYDVSFPNKAGTVAFLSDIPSLTNYLRTDIDGAINANLIIGSTTPQSTYKLEIVSSSASLAKFTRTSTNNAGLTLGNLSQEWIMGSTQNGDFGISQNADIGSNGVLFIDKTTQYVGMGAGAAASSPTERLSVYGNGLFTGTVQGANATASNQFITKGQAEGLFLTTNKTYLAKSAPYTTLSSENGAPLLLGSGVTSLTLDDALLSVGFNQSYYNVTGATIPIVFGTGNFSYKDLITEIKDGETLKVDLISDNTWILIIGKNYSPIYTNATASATLKLDKVQTYYTAQYAASYTISNTAGDRNLGSYIKMAITTTGQTAFPAVTGTNVEATPRDGSSFAADTLYDLYIGTDDGVNVYYFFIKR